MFRGGRGRGRGRGGMKHGGSGPNWSQRGGKRKTKFENHGAGSDFKRKRFDGSQQQPSTELLNDSTTSDWGCEPIAQQPLHHQTVGETNDEWC